MSAHISDKSLIVLYMEDGFKFSVDENLRTGLAARISSFCQELNLPLETIEIK